MKHTWTITALLLVLFVGTQLIGLFLIQQSIADVAVDQDTGNIEVVYEETAIGERPQTSGVGSFLYLLFGVAVATGIMLLLVKYKKIVFWKVWYFLAVTVTTSVALGVLLPALIAVAIGIVLAVFKLWKRNIFTHNLTEVLIYAGIAVLLAPLFNLLWASMLLLAISAYDAYAVWKSKHMVKMAEFQTKADMFAGLFIPYKRKQAAHPVPDQPPRPVKKRANSAVLGGGDLAFPLIFSGVVLGWLIQQGYAVGTAFWLTLFVTLFSAIALGGLFFAAKKDRFYPAMPFLSAGCFVGLAVIWLCF